MVNILQQACVDPTQATTIREPPNTPSEKERSLATKFGKYGNVVTNLKAEPQAEKHKAVPCASATPKNPAKATEASAKGSEE